MSYSSYLVRGCHLGMRPKSIACASRSRAASGVTTTVALNRARSLARNASRSRRRRARVRLTVSPPSTEVLLSSRRTSPRYQLPMRPRRRVGRDPDLGLVVEGDTPRGAAVDQVGDAEANQVPSIVARVRLPPADADEEPMGSSFQAAFALGRGSLPTRPERLPSSRHEPVFRACS